MGGEDKVNMENIVRENISEEKSYKAIGFEFVKFSYRADDALKRRNAVRDAYESIEKTVAETGGDMPRDLALLYEEMAEIMRNIMAGENGVMRTGR